VRVLRLTVLFHRTRRVHAPPGSPEDRAVRIALAALMRGREPLPAPGDEEALRTPLEVIWARRIADTGLVLTYSVTEDVVAVQSVRPAW